VSASPWLAEELGTDLATASAVLDVMLDPAAGWPGTAGLEPGALDAVWRLRVDLGRPPALPPDRYRWPWDGEQAR
jgi:hypothetical protein